MTRKIHWKERPGVKEEFTSAPLAADGQTIFLDVYVGRTLLIKPGKQLDIVSNNYLRATGEHVCGQPLEILTSADVDRTRPQELQA